MTNRIAWASDLHLNEASHEKLQAFWKQLPTLDAQALLLTGDISEGECFESHLQQIDKLAPCPVYFVLGNHDYYGRQIADVRQFASRPWQRLRYLPVIDPVPLSSEIALVGQEGWADGRAGDYWNSLIQLRDFDEIEDLKGLSKAKRLEQLHDLADDAVQKLQGTLQNALSHFSQVWIATHVPPFEASALYQENEADSHWAPHMVCVILGKTLKEISLLFPKQHFRVFCGHSHHAADIQVLPNLRVQTSSACSLIETFLEIR